MINLTFDDVARYAQEGIQERGGDYIYKGHGPKQDGPRCKYVHEGQPDCFVGLILHKAGVELTEEMNSLGPAATALVTLKDNGVLAYDYKTSHFLRFLQSEQDAGITWGIAYEHAFKRAESLNATE